MKDQEHLDKGLPSIDRSSASGNVPVIATVYFAPASSTEADPASEVASDSPASSLIVPGGVDRNHDRVEAPNNDIPSVNQSTSGAAGVDTVVSVNASTFASSTAANANVSAIVDRRPRPITINTNLDDVEKNAKVGNAVPSFDYPPLLPVHPVGNPTVGTAPEVSSLPSIELNWGVASISNHKEDRRSAAAPSSDHPSLAPRSASAQMQPNLVNPVDYNAQRRIVAFEDVATGSTEIAPARLLDHGRVVDGSLEDEFEAYGINLGGTGGERFTPTQPSPCPHSVINFACESGKRFAISLAPKDSIPIPLRGAATTSSPQSVDVPSPDCHPSIPEAAAAEGRLPVNDTFPIPTSSLDLPVPGSSDFWKARQDISTLRNELSELRNNYSLLAREHSESRHQVSVLGKAYQVLDGRFRNLLFCQAPEVFTQPIPGISYHNSPVFRSDPDYQALLDSQTRCEEQLRRSQELTLTMARDLNNYLTALRRTEDIRLSVMEAYVQWIQTELLKMIAVLRSSSPDASRQLDLHRQNLSTHLRELFRDELVPQSLWFDSEPALLHQGLNPLDMAPEDRLAVAGHAFSRIPLSSASTHQGHPEGFPLRNPQFHTRDPNITSLDPHACSPHDAASIPVPALDPDGLCDVYLSHQAKQTIALVERRFAFARDLYRNPDKDSKPAAKRSKHT